MGPAKAATNLTKHGVSFAEAVAVLENPTSEHDVDMSRGDMRLSVTGWSLRGRILFVVCAEVDGDTIRIISARKATRAEVAAYEENQ
jgi:uncharacterized DUF497 family protein